VQTMQVVVAAIAVLVTLFIFAVNRVHDRRIRRAELLRNYTNDFYSDKRITDLFMDVDHSRYSIDEEEIGTEKELALIRLLDFLNILGYNWLRGVVRIRDIAPTTLGYAAVRLHSDRSVVWYMTKVEVWDQERYVPGTGFGYFRELAVALASYPSSASNSAWVRMRVGLSQVRHELTATARGRLRLMLPRAVVTTSQVVTDLNPDCRPS
jgi:hypothetical protein